MNRVHGGAESLDHKACINKATWFDVLSHEDTVWVDPQLLPKKGRVHNVLLYVEYYLGM